MDQEKNENQVFSHIFQEKQAYNQHLKEERLKNGIISSYDDDLIFERDESDFNLGGEDSPSQRVFKEKENSEKMYNDLSVKKKLSKLL